MASSFITKDNNFGFWIHDSIFQVACRYLHTTIAENFYRDKDEKWVNELQVSLDNNAKGFYHSYMHLDLDDLIADSVSKIKFNDICASAKMNIKNKGDFISIDELTQWYNKGLIDYEWTSPLKTIRLIKVLDYLEDLVNDKIAIKGTDEIDYEF